MKKELLEFLMNRKDVPEILRVTSEKDILLSFRGRLIVLKFLLLGGAGALLSLAVCPQFGLGFMEGHGIAHFFRMMGDGVCAAFCGSFFLTSAMITASLGMKGEEIWWIWHRHKYPLIFLPAVLWGGLMLTNVSLHLRSEIPTFHLLWVLMAILAEVLLFLLRNRIFFWNIKKVHEA